MSLSVRSRFYFRMHRESEGKLVPFAVSFLKRSVVQFPVRKEISFIHSQSIRLSMRIRVSHLDLKINKFVFSKLLPFLFCSGGFFSTLNLRREAEFPYSAFERRKTKKTRA
ncbi:hypothetical protein CEXT_567721 [Caerostris extrusa]|uniref:Uncharacterized protein n=1 Tax=Caerostris extrusa TaxID=172846 RepID=A0AAV4QYG0_CAEEX|nr:hypothetical protein CEXT_567721 [Caerostris extrusa]